MKKLTILLTVLALVSVLSLTLAFSGCGAEKDEDDIPLSVWDEDLEATPGEDPEEEEIAAEEEADADPDETPEAAKPDAAPAPAPAAPGQKPAQTPNQTPSQTPSQPSQQPSQGEDTVGQTLKKAFLADPSGSALTVAERLAAQPVLDFGAVAEPVQPGLLNGFGNDPITGFSEGAVFGPEIGAIPFLGYVFTLDGSVDGAAFCQTLKNSANLRWNICTEADELVVAQSGRTVFFVMCQEHLA